MLAIEEFLLGDTSAGEFNCSKHMTDAKKKLIHKITQTGRIKTMESDRYIKDTISVFWSEFCRPLAALDRCTLSRGAFAFKIHWGDSEMAAQGRVTLNRGGRNSRFDCNR